jgi:Lrp/AsnC family leucine-responsive transcriptional regulator
MDEIDRDILKILQADASLSRAEIARRVELTPSAVFERIRKLEQKGVILGYEARVDPKAFGLDLLAFVFVREDKAKPGSEAGPLLARIPGVEEVHKTAGDDCFIVKVRAHNTEELSRILDEDFLGIESVRGRGGVRTTIVLQTVKESAVVVPDSVAVPD